MIGKRIIFKDNLNVAINASLCKKSSHIEIQLQITNVCDDLFACNLNSITTNVSNDWYIIVILFFKFKGISKVREWLIEKSHILIMGIIVFCLYCCPEIDQIKHNKACLARFKFYSIESKTEGGQTPEVIFSIWLTFMPIPSWSCATVKLTKNNSKISFWYFDC